MLVLRTKSRVRSTCRPLSRPQVPRSPRCQVPESPVTRLIEERSDRSAAPRHPAPSFPQQLVPVAAQWASHQRAAGGPWWPLVALLLLLCGTVQVHAARSPPRRGRVQGDCTAGLDAQSAQCTWSDWSDCRAIRAMRAIRAIRRAARKSLLLDLRPLLPIWPANLAPSSGGSAASW